MEGVALEGLETEVSNRKGALQAVAVMLTPMEKMDLEEVVLERLTMIEIICLLVMAAQE